MRIDFNISNTEGGKFRAACETVIRNVGAGTREAVTEAGVSIMTDSFAQVPVDTGTLASSAYLGVSRRDDVVGYRYGAVLGYGTPEGLAGSLGLNNKKSVVAHDPGGPYVFKNGKAVKSAPARSYRVMVDVPIDWYMKPNNAINPKSSLPASAYAGTVHEDLDMAHPNGGKAKFLEDPVRNWASGKFARTAMTYWAKAINWSKFNTSGMRFNSRAGKFKFIASAPIMYTKYNFVQRSSGVQRGGSSVHKGADK